MTDLGCFEITKDFFHLVYRPINMLPMDRVTIGTEFHLYTKKHPMEYHLVKYNDKESMKELDITHRTVFIVHGFVDSKYYGKWLEVSSPFSVHCSMRGKCEKTTITLVFSAFAHIIQGVIVIKLGIFREHYSSN